MTDDDEARRDRPARERRPRGDGERPRSGRPRDEARRDTGRPVRRGDAQARPRSDRRPDGETGRRSAERPRRDRPSGAHAAPDGPRHVDEPSLSDDVRAADLDRNARQELRTLSKENADAVARHLVMASRLIEDDPELAHRHALAAGRRAGRVAIVRESVAITAYAVQDFPLAVRELRTFRRISGSDDQIALLVDSERGVGRPDRALEAGRAVDRASLPVESQVGLAIAMSGARLDLGDATAALDELERAPYDLSVVHIWSADLYRAFATVHEELGDAAEAARWVARADRAERVLGEVDAESDTVAITEERPAGEDGAEEDRAPADREAR